MKKIGTAVALTACLALGSCLAGPHQLRRSVDDWDHKLYVQNPILNGVMHFIPIIPLMSLGAFFGDTFTGDAVAFWASDAWDGKGTGFVHFDPEHEDGAMESFLLDDAKWMKVVD